MLTAFPRRRCDRDKPATDGEAIEDIFKTTAVPDIHDDLAAVFEQMDADHPSDRPHWYLPLIAANYGDSLLNPFLDANFGHASPTILGI